MWFRRRPGVPIPKGPRPQVVTSWQYCGPSAGALFRYRPPGVPLHCFFSAIQEDTRILTQRVLATLAPRLWGYLYTNNERTISSHSSFGGAMLRTETRRDDGCWAVGLLL